MSLFGNAFGLGDIVGDIPVIGELFDSKSGLAGDAQMKNMAEVAAAYEGYRPQYQENNQRALQNMAMMMGPLNDFTASRGGQAIDFDAILGNPVVNPAQFAPQQQAPYQPPPVQGGIGGAAVDPRLLFLQQQQEALNNPQPQAAPAPPTSPFQFGR